MCVCIRACADVRMVEALPPEWPYSSLCIHIQYIIFTVCLSVNCAVVSSLWSVLCVVEKYVECACAMCAVATSVVWLAPVLEMRARVPAHAIA